MGYIPGAAKYVSIIGVIYETTRNKELQTKNQK
jgi:hypothetical protein